jgi:predicted regulator of Ras-like GTPase activity (Roadblock/LC7/MglB family)
LVIPLEILEKDLKSGRIEHNWIQVCSWITSDSSATDSTKHGDVRLELPLNVVAPLYFKERQASTAKKSYVPSEIPDLFNSNVPPTEESAPAEEVETEVEAAPAPAPASRPAGNKAKKKVPSNIAELFGEPQKRNWTPNEIVHKTAELDGIAGALIALQDGLLVAACMPPEWKSETVAAFLPQMFGRLKQYARELNVGELKSLMITVEKGPLLVFNAGLIYFAVLGFNEDPMPMQNLTVIATELSRHTK